MDTEFNITAEESQRTGLREYDPSGGVKNTDLQFQVEYAQNKNWSLHGVADIEHYLGNATDSP